MDAVGNIKPSKRKSVEKIDLAVALIMVVGTAAAYPVEIGSVYNKRCIIYI